jgi:hypothetical protein
MPVADSVALAAEVERRGLVRRSKAFSSLHRGVSWDTQRKRWRVRLHHGGEREFDGLFATEAEAKARRDARCLELGVDLDAGTASCFRGVSWHKGSCKWQVQISIGGKVKTLGLFEATVRGEVDAALAFDVAARAAGRPEKANFKPAGGDSGGANDEEALTTAGGSGSSTGAAPAVPQEAEEGPSLTEADRVALAVEAELRGLGWRDSTACRSRHTGVSCTCGCTRAKPRHLVLLETLALHEDATAEVVQLCFALHQHFETMEMDHVENLN